MTKYNLYWQDTDGEWYGPIEAEADSINEAELIALDLPGDKYKVEEA